MNILMILDGEFPPDDRVEKEALSLISEGNKVFLLCLNYGNFKDAENYKGIEIKRIRINKSYRNKIQATYLILPLYRIIWKKAIVRMITSHSVNIIHVHDLPLSDIPLALRKKYNLKVVCDQHEFYSNWIVRTAHYNTFTGKIVKAFSNWIKYERKCLLNCDLAVTVADALRDQYIALHGISPQKIVVLPNTPSRAIFNSETTNPQIIEKYKNDFVLFYAGNIDILRGIDTIIASIPLLRNTIPNFKFVLAGKFNSKYYDPLKYADKLGVTDLIEFIGWVPIESLPSYIAASNVCIFVPPAHNIEINSSIVTKIYQYLVMNKPIIVGQAKMMKNFIELNNIGMSINDSDPEDLAKKLISLYLNPDLINQFTSNTRLISDNYYWEVTSEQFLGKYRSIYR